MNAANGADENVTMPCPGDRENGEMGSGRYRGLVRVMLGRSMGMPDLPLFHEVLAAKGTEHGIDHDKAACAADSGRAWKGRTDLVSRCKREGILRNLQ